MVNKEVEEFVVLCSSILSDGEVTEDEAYQLADWLNHHDEAAEQWPGNQLIQPLQEIWADGTVSRRELHRLARLLISVQREWARHPRTKITSLTSGELPRLSTDQNEVRLPNLHGRFRVPSQSEPGRFYEVDLNGPTCTCPDWRNRRSRLPTGDLTRCCKHILHVYARLVDPGTTDNWLVAFIQYGWPSHPQARWHLLDHNGTKILFCTACEQGWANVFASDGKQYERFGYNTLEDRWAYGIEPEDAASIASAIADCRSEPSSTASSHVPDANERTALARSLLALPTAKTPPPLPPLAPGPRPRRSRWVLAAGSVTILLITAGLFVVREIKSAHSKVTTSSASIVTTSKNSPIPFSSPPARNTPTHLPAKPAASSSAWTVITRQNVKTKAGKRDIVIPRGTTLKVIARTSSDLMISYKGEDLTIPASATTSPP